MPKKSEKLDVYVDTPDVITNEEDTFSIFYLLRNTTILSKAMRLLQAQHFSVPEGLIKTALCNLCNLRDHNRYLYIGQFLELSFRWRTHL